MKYFESTGYYGKKMAEFEELIEKGWLVVDVRISPFSRFQPDFIGKRMAANLGEGYLHIPEWGNPRRKEGVLAIADFSAGLSKALATRAQKILLLCACKYPEKCHRSLLVKLLQAAGYEAKESD